MTLRKRKLAEALCLALILTPLGFDLAQAQPAKRPAAKCFQLRDWTGWRVTKDAKAMFISAGGRNVYRADFAGACPALRWTSAHPVIRVRGSSWICSALDLDMHVSDGNGIATPCIVRQLTPLSPEEVAALPKGLKP